MEKEIQEVQPEEICTIRIAYTKILTSKKFRKQVDIFTISPNRVCFQKNQWIISVWYLKKYRIEY
ncbi:MAG: hypothetical protein WDO19_01820 [Bacteroidota bacterium]